MALTCGIAGHQFPLTRRALERMEKLLTSSNREPATEEKKSYAGRAYNSRHPARSLLSSIMPPGVNVKGRNASNPLRPQANKSHVLSLTGRNLPGHTVN